MESDRLTKLPRWPRFIRIVGVFTFTAVLCVIYAVIQNWKVLGTLEASEEIWLAARNGFRAGFVLSVIFVIIRTVVELLKSASESKPPNKQLHEEDQITCLRNMPKD